MLSKAIFGAIGVILMAIFLGAVVVKVQEVALAIVVLIGLALMALDAWQSIRESD